MINQHPCKNDPDIVKALFHWPLHLLFFLFIALFPFSEYWSEVFLWLCSGLTLLYILVRLFVLRSESNVFRLGGDISLLIFITAALVGWNNADALSFGQLFHVRWFIIIYVLSYFFDLLPNLNARINFLLVSTTALALTGIFQAFDLKFLDSVFASPPVYRNPGSVLAWVPHAAMGFFPSPFHFGVIAAMGLSFPLSILIFHRRLARLTKFFLLLTCAVFIAAAALTFDHAVYIAVAVVFCAQLLMKRQIAMFGLATICGIAIYYFGSQSPLAHKDPPKNQQKLHSTLELFQEKVFFGHGFHLETGSLQQTQPAQNTYFQLLAGTGLIGFAGFLLFALQFLFIILRLWQEIPPTHFWHRSYLAACIGIQAIFHYAGLKTWSLGQHTMVSFFFLSVVVVAVLSERYGSTIVSDDYSI